MYLEHISFDISCDSGGKYVAKICRGRGGGAGSESNNWNKNDTDDNNNNNNNNNNNDTYKVFAGHLCVHLALERGLGVARRVGNITTCGESYSKVTRVQGNGK
jgi:hypothetical protein